MKGGACNHNDMHPMEDKETGQELKDGSPEVAKSTPERASTKSPVVSLKACLGSLLRMGSKGSLESAKSGIGSPRSRRRVSFEKTLTATKDDQDSKMS